MSFVPGGGYNIWIQAKKSGDWWYKHGRPGWPGNTIIQAQPVPAPGSLSPYLGTGAELVCVPGKIVFDKYGTYTFWTKITNQGSSDTWFNLQVSVS